MKGPHRHPRRKPRPASRAFRPRSPEERRPDALWVYGIHSAAAALANPRRKIRRIVATKNALRRLEEERVRLPLAPEVANPRDIDRILGPEAAHQGIAVEVAPLADATLADIAAERLVIVLDQITDPHNVGAIVRSAAAFGAGGIVTTGRHAPAEGAVLAKSASGGLEHVPIVRAVNLGRALEELGGAGFARIGLDSSGSEPLESALAGERIALVLGAEGKGLRKGTREMCDRVARLDVPGAIRSLNVSNAAAVALYLARRHLGPA